MSKSRRKLSVDQELCSGCQRCALACSFFTTTEREFNLTKSKISVVPAWDMAQFEVSLSDECTHCGICIPYCDFGVLGRQEAMETPVQA